MTALQLAAPYVAVLVFWVGYRSAWLAILAYHAQMAFWLFRDPPPRTMLRPTRFLAFALPSVLAGPVVYMMLPHIISTDMGAWLGRFGLSGPLLLLMVPYFGLLHPPLEQLYWTPLRERTPVAHPLFAGYHVIVLASLLPPLWLAACFVILLAASVMWQQMYRRSGGALVAIASHVMADAGIVVAAYLLASGGA